MPLIPLKAERVSWGGCRPANPPRLRRITSRKCSDDLPLGGAAPPPNSLPLRTVYLLLWVLTAGLPHTSAPKNP